MWCCSQSFFSLCLACLGQMLRAVPLYRYLDIWIFWISTHHCLKSSIMVVIDELLSWGVEAAFLERHPTPFLQTHRAAWTLDIPTVERLVLGNSNSSVVQRLNITYANIVILHIYTRVYIYILYRYYIIYIIYLLLHI